MAPRPKIVAVLLAVVSILLALLLPLSSPAQAATGSISGKVTDKSGTPLAGITVSAWTYKFSDSQLEAPTGPPAASGTSAVDGSYSLGGLADGDYILWFSGTGYASAKNSGGVVRIYQGSAPTGIDIRMEAGTGTVSGTVKGLDGEAIPGAKLILEREGGTGGGRWTTYAGADGSYSFANVPVGKFIVSAMAQKYVGGYYPTGGGFQTAKFFSLAASQNLSGINIALGKACFVSGTVTDTNGNPLANMELALHYGWMESGQLSWVPVYGTQVKSDASGQFALYLAPGEYRLQATDPAKVFASSFYGGSSLANAKSVNPTTGGTISGLSIVMPKGASISGTAALSPALQLNSSWSFVAEAVDAQTGTVVATAALTSPQWTINGLPPGTYRVRFLQNSMNPAPLAVEWWNDQALAGNASTIEIGEGQAIGNINVSFEKAARVQGAITVTSTATPPYLSLGAFTQDSNGRWEMAGVTSGYSPSATTHSVNQLKQGTYRICAFADTRNATATIYGCYGAESPVDATPVTVAEGDTLTDKNITITRTSPIVLPTPSPSGSPTTPPVVPSSGPAGPRPTTLPATTAATATAAATATPQPATKAPVAAPTQAAVPPAPATITLPTAPKIVGIAKVGKALKVPTIAVTPAAATISYQWLRNGKPIAKATKSAYKLTSKDRKAKIAVTLTISAPGIATVTKTVSVAKKVS